MSTKKTPTKSAPKKRVKPRDGATMADYLEKPASPAADMEVVGRTSRPGGIAVLGEAMGGASVGVLGASVARDGVGVKAEAQIGVFATGGNLGAGVHGEGTT